MEQKEYIGVKFVMAKPITLEKFIEETGRNPYSNNPNPAENLQEGYAVTYEDGYVGYSPKEVFERSYREVDELNSTCINVISKDYKERFIGEHRALCVRKERLSRMLHAWDSGLLNFTPTCPKELLKHQEAVMQEYIDILVERGKLEGVLVAESDAQ